jgi:hypothetical protein
LIEEPFEGEEPVEVVVDEGLHHYDGEVLWLKIYSQNSGKLSNTARN